MNAGQYWSGMLRLDHTNGLPYYYCFLFASQFHFFIIIIIIITIIIIIILFNHYFALAPEQPQAAKTELVRRKNKERRRKTLKTCPVAYKPHSLASPNSPCPSNCLLQRQAEHFKAVFLPAALITKIICLEKHLSFLNIGGPEKWHPCFYQQNQSKLSCALHALMSQPA